MASRASPRATSHNAAWSCILSADESASGSGPVDDLASTLPATPAAALAVFGERLPLVQAYAEMLAGDGVQRGLIGPREAPRLWDRHLLNCAAIAGAFPIGARVVDVGSGAGLPGIVLACARPDLHIDLVDSLQRRTRFLSDVVDGLGITDQVRVVTGRAEDGAVRDVVGRSQWVAARAVAPLERLVGWCLPLLVSGGTLIAMKGATAADELRRAGPALRKLGVASSTVVEHGVGLVDPPTRAVHVVRR